MFGTATASLAALLVCSTLVAARPAVRNLKNLAEFNKLIKHHKENTGLPVIVDFYSDGCGPCRQIAPMYKKMAKAMKGKAVFTKVDVNFARDISGAQQIRSMPTFQFYSMGKKKHQFSGGDPNQLQQWAQNLATDAEKYNVQLTKDNLIAFYKENAPDKIDEAKIDELLAKAGEGGGPGHYKLVKKLNKKYGKKPELLPNENLMDKDEKKKKEEAKAGPGIKKATTEELKAELELRMEAEQDKKDQEAEDSDEEEVSPIKFFSKGDYAERVAIVGAGPAGLAAAIYAARAGLRPVVVAPPMGGQLQGKGVMVENYPAVAGVTGPMIVADMVKQAAEFETVFLQELVDEVDFSSRPFTIKTNTTTFQAHTVILSTGADSRWLGIEGEHKYRGGGVSSCATCDGFLYKDQEVIVIGGGDTAMEDALVLARTSSKVTVIHRRDSFRASHVLAQRVLQNDKIEVLWNKTTVKFEGEKVALPSDGTEGETEEIDSLTTVHLKDTATGEASTIKCTAAFVAIGHIPNTKFVEGKLTMDKQGYVVAKGDGSTKTSIEGVFAAGDVADKVYRQAITSAGSGAMAALDAERWLSEEGIGDEAAEAEAEMMRELLAEAAMEEREETEYPDTYKEPKKEEPKKEEPAAEEPTVDDNGEEIVEEVEEEAAHTEL